MQAPKGCAAWNEGDVRVIDYRWRGHGILAPFSAAFGLALTFVAYMILETEGSIALSGVGFAMAAAMVYWGGAGWFNRTVIRVSPQQIAVQTGPLPAFGNTSVATQDVAGINLRVRVSSTGKGGTSTSCSIWTKTSRRK